MDRFPPNKYEKIQGIQMKFNQLFNEKVTNVQTEFEKLPNLPDPIKADRDLFKGKPKTKVLHFDM